MKISGIQIYELSPMGANSFYGKAHVIIKNGIRYLKSYETIVASVDQNGNIRRYWADWSATTGRHIYAFCGLRKKDWDKLKVVKCRLVKE